MKKYANTNSLNVSNISSVGLYDKYIVDKKIYKEIEYLNFEGFKLPVPINRENYLKNLYGNYMKYPPKNKRFNHQHNLVKVSLNKEEMIY